MQKTMAIPRSRESEAGCKAEIKATLREIQRCIDQMKAANLRIAKLEARTRANLAELSAF